MYFSIIHYYHVDMLLVSNYYIRFRKTRIYSRKIKFSTIFRSLFDNILREFYNLQVEGEYFRHTIVIQFFAFFRLLTFRYQISATGLEFIHSCHLFHLPCMIVLLFFILLLIILTAARFSSVHLCCFLNVFHVFTSISDICVSYSNGNFLGQIICWDIMIFLPRFTAIRGRIFLLSRMLPQNKLIACKYIHLMSISAFLFDS